jgi:hypothetical protein
MFGENFRPLEPIKISEVERNGKLIFVLGIFNF